MVRSTFDFDGLNLGTGDKNITYLYGLSDFWAVMFEGSDKINLLLEANAQSASDIYSKFLQLTSTLSLEQIQTDMGYQTKLVLLNQEALVTGSVNVYNLPTIIPDARFLADRPLLPNLTLEKGVGYSIINDGTQIQFFSPLSSLGFPVRINADGTQDYAIWFTDAVVDELTIYNYYGRLIGLDPHTSTQNFKNFVQGLYYLFVNGPSVEWMKKGLNLALGIPLARATEVVLDIRKYLDSQQYLVTTDSNSYLIPFGLSPSVAVNDILNLGDELAEWIEVKDWKEDDSWWLNLYIPPALIPYVPTGQTDRHALPGSYADYLMANYLKNHSFLVNVLVVDHSNLEFLTQIPKIINEAKPTYTYPVYIWTVPNDEILNIDDSEFTYRWDQFLCDNLSLPITSMTRSIIFGNFSQNYNRGLTVTNSGLTLTATDSSSRSAVTDFYKASAKWYWEVKINTPVSNTYIGMASNNYKLDDNSLSQTYTYNNATVLSFNDVLGVAADIDNLKLNFYVNSVFVNFVTLDPGVALVPYIGLFTNTASVTFNFGQNPFFYTPPTGYFAGYFDKQSLTRGCPQFIRSNISNQVQQLVGGADVFNGLTTNLDGGTLTGFLNVENQYRANTNPELAWLRAIFTRNTNEPPNTRGKIALKRRGNTPGILPIYNLTSVGTKATVLFNPYASFTTRSSAVQTNQLANTITHNNDPYCWGTAIGTVGAGSDRWYWEHILTKLPVPSRFCIGIADYSVDQGNYWPPESGKFYGVDVERKNILTLDGSTQYITAPQSTPMNIFGAHVQSFTIEARFNCATVPTLGAIRNILEKADSTGAFNPNGNGIGIRLINNVLQVVRSDGDGTGGTVISSAAIIQANTNYHVIFGWDGPNSKIYLYLNGVPSAGNGTTSTGNADYSDTFDFIIGKGSDSLFNGVICDVRIFNRLMPGVEALERYKYYNKSDVGLVGYWPINEGTGTSFQDQSGNAATGTSTGSPVWSVGNYNYFYSGSTSSTSNPTYAEGDTIGVSYDNVQKIMEVYGGGVTVTSISDNSVLYPVIAINTPGTQITANTSLNTLSFYPHEGQTLGIYDKSKSYQYAVGQNITISGAATPAFNGKFTITEAGPNTFSYTMASSAVAQDANFNTALISSSEGLSKSTYDQIGQAGIIYPLYITTQADIVAKFTTMSLPVPGLDQWVFTAFAPVSTDGPINSYAIDATISTNYFASLQSYFTTLFTRGVTANYLGHFMPETARGYTYLPLTTDLQQNDYILFIRIQENTVGVYWVTSNANPSVAPPVYFGLQQTDTMAFSMKAALSRGLGATGSPYYTLRGDSYSVSYNNYRGIDGILIDDTDQLQSLIQATYTDAVNSNVPIDRSGSPRINITKQLL